MTSTAATIAATEWRTAEMSSLPDQAPAQQCPPVRPGRVALPRSSWVWGTVTGGWMLSLGGWGRRRSSFSGASRAGVGGPSYTATVFGATAAPRDAEVVQAFTSQSISAGAFVVIRKLPGGR